MTRRSRVRPCNVTILLTPLLTSYMCRVSPVCMLCSRCKGQRRSAGRSGLLANKRCVCRFRYKDPRNFISWISCSSSGKGGSTPYNTCTCTKTRAGWGVEGGRGVGVVALRCLDDPPRVLEEEVGVGPNGRVLWWLLEGPPGPEGPPEGKGVPRGWVGWKPGVAGRARARVRSQQRRSRRRVGVGGGRRGWRLLGTRGMGVYMAGGKRGVVKGEGGVSEGVMRGEVGVRRGE